MKVLIADKFEKSGIEGLKAAGAEVLYQPDLNGPTLVTALSDTKADVLVVRSTSVTEEMLDKGNLSLVVRAGAGYNTIDVPAATRRGVYVSNCPGKNSIAVAELTIGLMLALDRRIPDNVAELRAGAWNKKEYSRAAGLYGKTLGLLGFGNIGQEVARRAQALGMNLVVWSRRFGTERRAGQAAARELGLDSSGATTVEIVGSPREVVEKADVVSVHLALTADTKGLIGADLLNHLKPGATFINTARAEVVDYRALEAEVKERGIRVGLDVFAGEPSSATGEFKDSLLGLPNVYGTHHIGASTDQAQEAIAAETVRIVSAYKETGNVPNAVNNPGNAR
jgi:D-3-phosphoglycerate dehydrogenase